MTRKSITIETAICDRCGFTEKTESHDGQTVFGGHVNIVQEIHTELVTLYDERQLVSMFDLCPDCRLEWRNTLADFHYQWVNNPKPGKNLDAKEKQDAAQSQTEKEKPAQSQGHQQKQPPVDQSPRSETGKRFWLIAILGDDD